MTLLQQNWLFKKPIAHRGLHSNDSKVPENSLLSFEKAIHHQFPIELDVQVLSDNKVIVFHDDNLKRMCASEKSVAELDSTQIKKFFLLNSKETIPLLSEVLDFVNNRVPILIELKSFKRAGAFESIVYSALKSYQGEYAIQSFNPMSVGWFAKHAPRVLRGQLSSEFDNENINLLVKFLLKNFYLNFISKPDFISYCLTNMPNKKIETFRKKGKPVLCWTIKSKEEYFKSKSYCDNIIFEGFLPEYK